MSTPPELPDVGTRVSLRYLRPPGSDPSMGDVLGQLVEVGPRVRVRAADGEVHEFRLADVLYVRSLTDRPVKNSAIRAVEHAAALAWPGTAHEWLDGWWLRAGPGGDLAANSAVPLDMYVQASTIPAIIDWYAGRGLPPRLAVPERLSPAGGRYPQRLPENIPTVWQTRTLVSDLAGASDDSEVALASRPDDDWLQVHRAAGGDVPVDVLTAVVDGEVVFASIPGVAVGRATVTAAPDGSRWLGLFAVRVAEEQRRHGHGRAIYAALHAWGVQHGATRGYTHIDSAHPAAFGFFEAIGFAGQHRTRYLDAHLLRP